LAEILPEKWYPEQKCKIKAKYEIAHGIHYFGKAKRHLSRLCRKVPDSRIRTLKADKNGMLKF
jgi:hypothetical protein